MSGSVGLFATTRRGFLTLLAALGALMPWISRGESASRLSNREAEFYRKADSDQPL